MKYIKLLIIVVCLLLSNSKVIMGQKGNINGQIQTNKLEVSTKLEEQTYCDDKINQDIYQIRLKLRVNYKNNSDRNIILYSGKRISFFNTLISYNEKDAYAEKYVDSYEACSALSPKKFSVQTKLGKDFIILAPGQVFTGEAEVFALIDRPGFNNYLQPGEYVLQIVTSTWPGTKLQEKTLRRKWKKYGFLHSSNVISLPMKFFIVNNPYVVSCS